MNVVSLLAELANADIRLWLEEGQLRFSAPEGAMTEARISELRSHKAEIIDFLSQSVAASSTIQPIDRSLDLPLSFAQQRLWFLNRLEPSNSAYHIHAALDIKGSLDINKLSQACQCILERHEILRSRYILKAGKTYQVIDPAEKISLTAEAAQLEDINSLLEKELNTPFDLANGPIMRLKLLQVSATHHVLSFTIHHIASDGWSMGIFVSELIRFYHSSEAEIKTASTNTAIQYADYANWQQQAEQLDAQQQGLDYWKTQLQETAVLDLACDYQRHKEQSSDSASFSFTVSEQQQNALTELCQQQGATLFMGLLALYATLLQRSNGQSDFAIGSPVAGRPQSQLEQLMGCFVNVLALRFDFSEALNFTQLLQQVKETCSKAFQYQDVPFEQIVNELEIERDVLINPVFQTLLVLQNSPLDAKAIDGLEITPIEQADQAAQFDLSVNITPINNSLQVKLIYKKALFNAETIAQLGAEFQQLISEAIAKPETNLQQLELFDAARKAAISEQAASFNQTDKTIDLSQNVQQLFEQQAAATPNAIAISEQADDPISLSYGELNAKANQLAHFLMEQGIKPNDKIALELDCTADFIIALVASIKAGACYLPIDTAHPVERRDFIIEQSASKLVLSSALTEGSDKPRINLNELLTSDKLSSYSTNNPPISQQAEDSFYCIYTSGSTGQPKGVEVAQQSVTNLVQWYIDEYSINNSDKFAIISSIGFDLTQKNLLAPLCAGAALVLPAAEIFNPAAIKSLIHTQQVTAINCAPSVLHSILTSAANSSSNNSQQENALSSLRLVLVGGEPVSKQLATSVFSQTNNTCQFINMYGPTECTDISCCYEIPRNLNTSDTIYIGKPIQNVRAFIVDSQLRLCPPGKAGELLISGISVSKGYIGLDELNAKSFVAFNNAANKEQPAYRTGDLCRQHSDGNIEYLGRIDDQVKVRGLRIELGEIEQQLSNVEGIEKAVALAQNDKIAAYYSLSDKAAEAFDSSKMQSVRNRLLQTLPQYMLPASFTFMPTWPLTASGKINKRALPKPDFSQQNKAEYKAASSETESILVAIWQQVLGHEKIGVLDNFFELGGHSLNAAEVFALAQEHFSVDIPLKEIFEQPNIEHIASVIDKALLEADVFSSNGSDSDSDEEMESFVL
jgi:amino acid adenylation domain-containing protein